MKANLKKGMILLLATIMLITMISPTTDNVDAIGDYNNDANLQLAPEIMNSITLLTQEEFSSKRATIRQPIMEVLQRGLARTAPAVLENTFSMTKFDAQNKGEVTFTAYPGIGKPVNLSAYQKYMMMRQIMYYNQYYLNNPNETKKHPAADLYYGGVPVENNAVKKRIVTDPKYTSPLTTGLYIPAGEKVKIEVKGLRPGEKVSFGTHMQQAMGYQIGDYNTYYNTYDNMIKEESKKANPNYEALAIEIQAQYKRQNQELPLMGVGFSVDYKAGQETVTRTVGTLFGGQLHITGAPTTHPVEIIITGAVETPHFILGVTTPEEFDKYLRNAPGIVGTIDTENGQLIGVSAKTNGARALRDADDIEKVAYFWHSAFTIDVSFNGKPYNYYTKLTFDNHVPAGAAVALSANHAAHPTGWFNNCVKYENLVKTGAWGVLHELGHVHGNTYGVAWGLNGGQEGEVRNNTLIVLIYTMLCNMNPRVDSVGHGEVTHAYDTVQKMMSIKNKNRADLNDLEYFEALSLYANLIHQFSPEKFIEMLQTYKTNRTFPRGSGGNVRSEFAYRLARVYKYNFVPMLNEYFKTGIKDSMFTAEQLKEIKALPVYWPIASKIANGVNGFETSRPEIFSGYGDTTINFKAGGNGEIKCPKAFEIVKFNSPKYGTLKSVEEGTVIYTAPNKIVAKDEFSVTVKIKETGVIVDLPIRFYLSYNMAENVVYPNVKAGNLDAAIAESAKITPYTVHTTAPGVGNFNRGTQKDYIVSSFKFVADEAGKHTFYLRGDDYARVYASKTADMKNKLTMSIPKDNKNYDKAAGKFVTFDLAKNECVYFQGHLLNTGGLGNLYIGVVKPSKKDGNPIDIPSNNILGTSFDVSKLSEITAPKFEPVFLTSVKNTTNNDSIVKDGWKVLKAPAGQEGDGGVKEAIIDGNSGTYYHTRYKGSGITPMPHEYVIDMAKISKIDYIEVITRNNVNSFIRKYKLYVSTDNQKYDLVAQGDMQANNSHHSTMAFAERDARYIKLVVESVAGGRNFTVISEISAGLSGRMDKIAAPGTVDVSTGGDFKNDKNGEIVTSGKGKVFEFEFSGPRFYLFANTGADYGTASVYIDDKLSGQINLKDSSSSINKLVYKKSGLENKTHKVKIVTNDDAKFHLGFISIDYGSKIGAEVDEIEFLLGDVNNDKKVTIADAVDVLNYTADNKISYLLKASGSDLARAKKAADMDGNGKITISDAIAILRRTV